MMAAARRRLTVLLVALSSSGVRGYVHPRRSLAAPRPTSSRRAAARSEPRRAPRGRAATALAALTVRGAADSRVFEICRLDEDGHIYECLCKSEEELRAAGLLTSPRDPTSDLLFAVPNSGADGETLYSLADYETCLADDLCEVPDDIINKAYGPDVLRRLHEEEEEEEAAAADDADADDVDEPPVPPARTAARFHAHFGAGRLGLGLVVPAIAASGIPFAVVQRPKPRWEEVFRRGGGSIEIEVNDEVKVHGAEVVGAGTSPETTPAASLVFGASADDLGDLLQKATSFSCSLGAAMRRVMTSTLLALPEVLTENEVNALQIESEREAKKERRRRRFDPSAPTDGRSYSGDLDPASDPRPVLYCAENDHAAVAALKVQLRTRVRVVDCMVDRVCTGRRIAPSGVEIDAEPWPGSIVVLEPGFDERLVPFARTSVTLPESLKHADYLSERKFSLVNGMHTVLAFLTLDQIYAPKAGGREYVLLKYDQMRRRPQRAVEAWRTARVAHLLETFGEENVRRWEGLETREETWDALLAFGDEVLVDRFSAVDDLVSRVLGGGVANRYQTRLLPTKQWLDKRRGQSDGTTAFFAHASERDRRRAKARLGDGACDPWNPLCECDPDDAVEEPAASAVDAEAFVRDSCAELLAAGKRFVNKELEITHKKLIKEQRQFGGKKFSPTVQEALAEDKLRTAAILADRRRQREAKEKEMGDLYDPSISTESK